MAKKKIKTKKKTIKKNKESDIKNLKSGKIVKTINNENNCILKENNNTYKIKLLKKFSGGKSGDLVYLIKNKNNNYVLKIFMETKSANHEIKLHKKHCEIFGKNSLIPYLYSEGIIQGIPFSDKQSDMKEYRYLIMESINNPTELSDYIRSNCNKIKDKDIDPYLLSIQIFYYLSKLSKNKISHCDFHTKNILIIKSNSNLILDFSFIQPNKKINVGKYRVKVIDFGLSEINKPCPRNRRFIGAVLQDMRKCRVFKGSDIKDIKKDLIKIIKSGLLKKKIKNEIIINEDFYIFSKILRLLNKIKTEDCKLTKFKIKFIEELIINKKDIKQIFNVLII